MPGVSIVGLIRFGGHLPKDDPPLRKARWAPVASVPYKSCTHRKDNGRRNYGGGWSGGLDCLPVRG